MKKYISIILLMTKIGYSQDNLPIVQTPVPPSSWDFVKFGNVPVNEYRGLANISIPIQEINSNKVNIPIKLDYYSGGIRVDEEASVVGLGWSMNLPTIVQNVKDLNDYNAWHQKLPPYQGNPAIPTLEIYTNPSLGGAYNVNINQYMGVNSVQNIPYYANVTNGILVDQTGYYNTDFEYLQMIHEGVVDSEPDIFSLNLNGDEIKFSRTNSQNDVLDSQNQPILPLQIINGKTEYKVEVILNPMPNTPPFLKINGIKVIDPNGNNYYFNKLEIINPGGIINYKLTKIETNNNKVINFNYFETTVLGLNKVELTHLKKQGGSYSEGANFQCKGFDSFENQYFNGSPDQEISIGIGDNINSSSTNHISQNYCFLSSIVMENKTLLFEYSDRLDYFGMKKLDKITVKNIKDEVIDSYLFSYDYFDSTFDNSPRYNILNTSNSQANSNKEDRASKRLKLVSLTEMGNNPYVFEYNNVELPKKNSYSTDYWGFYNGSNNTNFKPNLAVLGYPNISQTTVNNHNSNLFYCKASSLEKIIYPTKGYSLFTYELNEFDNLLYGVENNPNIPAINTGAGLRIKSIENFDYNATLISKKTFNYFGGKAIFKKVLVNSGSFENFACNSYSETFNTRSTQIIVSNLNNFINNNSMIYGDYIGYDSIKIYDGIDNGYIEKKYYNNEYGLIYSYSSLFNGTDYFDKNSSFMNGTLLNEIIYDNLNNIILKKEFQYTPRTSILNYGMNKKSNGYRICVSDDGWGGTSPNFCDQAILNPRVLLTFYPISFKTIDISKEIITEFFGNKSKTIIKNFSYNSKNLLSNIKTFETSVLSTPLSEESFTYTFNHPNLISLSNLHNSNNILDLPAIITEKENDVLKSETQYTYDDYLLNTRPKEINIFYDFQNNSNKKLVYDLYDDKDNVLQYHQEHNINVSVIWGYNKTLPVAKIENATYSSISSSLIQAIQDASNTGTEAQLLIALENLRNALPDAMVITYTHKPLVGVSTMVDAKGNKFTYHYDTNNRLQFVKDKNGNVLSENEYHYKD
ncbi:hypothetical protein [Flavobacterium sp. J27]|uniref:hypothetical protein n=1 Tax=Flavobacterium sp. J27 TaxID=2060419 RepID=UPI001032581A|nr:hypothetical protein [Flavobacterium sp. J27]